MRCRTTPKKIRIVMNMVGRSATYMQFINFEDRELGITLPTGAWEVIGRPNQITVTVRAGDLLRGK